MGNSLGGKKRNSLGGKKSAKVMKVTGETIKLKTPVKANEVVKDYPGHVLLESEAVKHFGVRAKPLEPQQDLLPKRLYFLVELPKSFSEKTPRKVRSGINMSAKDRLETLMLARRSASDLSITRDRINGEISSGSSLVSGDNNDAGSMRVKMRIRKAEVERLVKESSDQSEVAKKIVDLCMENPRIGKINNVGFDDNVRKQHEKQDAQCKNNTRYGSVKDGPIKSRDQKRVSFLPANEEEIMQIAVGTY